jgi:hypothetical protein
MGVSLITSSVTGKGEAITGLRGRHLAKKLVPFLIRLPTPGYQATSFALHHVWTLARELPFRQSDYLSRTAPANEFLTFRRIPGGEFNLGHSNIVRLFQQARRDPRKLRFLATGDCDLAGMLQVRSRIQVARILQKRLDWLNSAPAAAQT